MTTSPLLLVESEPSQEENALRYSYILSLKRWFREPLLHFLLLGATLFAIYGYIHRGRAGVESSKQIALSLDELRQMDLYFESQWHRPPTPQELEAMVDDRVREGVLYRRICLGS